MKKLHKYIIAGMAFAMASCNDFIDVPPTGVIDGELAYSQPDKMVNAAYASLGDCWFEYPFNLWPYGDLGSDDCLKGGGGTTDNLLPPDGDMVDPDLHSRRTRPALVSPLLQHLALQPRPDRP